MSLLQRCFVALAFAALAFFSNTAAAEPVRLGWQVPWATQGQLVMALKHTTITDETGSNIEYVGFPYGGPLNRAALAGEVDVLFTADQPALTLLSKSDRWVIVGRLMYNRTALYVPKRSNINSLADLKGKAVSGPVSAAAERIALAALQKAGVAPTDIRAGNLDMAPQAALLKSSPDNKSWRGVDALYGFDPFAAMFEQAGYTRNLHTGNVVSVVVASRDFLEKRREALVSFLRSYVLAWHEYARHGDTLNRLFVEESRLDADAKALETAASVEPNRKAKTLKDIRLTFTPADLTVLDQALGFLVERKTVDKGFDFRKAIDLTPLEEALAWPEAQAAANRIKARDTKTTP